MPMISDKLYYEEDNLDYEEFINIQNYFLKLQLNSHMSWWSVWIFTKIK